MNIVNNFFGMPFYICDYLNEEVIKTVPIRYHKQKRIQKKWLKKYGTRNIYKPCGYWNAVGIYGNRAYINILRREFPNV